MRQWIIGTVAVLVVGLVNTFAWAQAQQAGALSEKSTITVSLAMSFGALLVSGVGAFFGTRIGMAKFDQKLTDHCTTQERDLTALGGRMTEAEHIHRDCPAHRQLRGE